MATRWPATAEPLAEKSLLQQTLNHKKVAAYTATFLYFYRICNVKMQRMQRIQSASLPGNPDTTMPCSNQTIQTGTFVPNWLFPHLY